jgi:RNA polymerase sigma factor (TIGR02999 family)
VSSPLRHELSPPPSRESSLTGLLQRWRNGSGTAFEAVIDEAYGRLKRIAQRRVNGFGGTPTLSATELLHEALIDVIPARVDWQNRAQFYATMSLVMRSVLVDHARSRSASKRGGGRVRVTLCDATLAVPETVTDLLAIDEALVKLEQLDARGATVLHLTYFAGLDRKQIADLLQTSVATIDRSLRFSRAWLRTVLEDGA